MKSASIFIVAASLALLPRVAFGQAVDPSVPVPDPSVKVRVQDPDHPDSALLPGGSAAWTGQPTMIQTATSLPTAQSGSSRANQFPSLSSTSLWGGASSAASPTTGSAPSPMQTSSAVQGHASLWTKLAGSRKMTMTLAGIDLQTARSNRFVEESSTDLIELSDQKAKLRMLKRATQKQARIKILNPFENKADAAGAGRWHASFDSARALEEQRHEEVLLLHHGYNAQAERRRRRHRAGTSTPGSR